MNELQEACVDGDLNEVRRLLSIGVDPNSQDALFHSSAQDQLEVVKILLEKGADAKSQDALWAASRYGNIEIMKLLLEYGADPNSQDALYWSYDKEIIKLLLEKGADPFAIVNDFEKNETLYLIIKHNLMPLEDIEKNKERISPEVWDKVYTDKIYTGHCSVDAIIWEVDSENE
jgi:ankyrin repeat protein